MFRAGSWSRNRTVRGLTAGGRFGRSTKVVSLILVLLMVSMLVVVPSTQCLASSAVSMRRVSIEVRVGQPAFSVTVDSKRSAATFPKAFLPVQVGSGLAFPLRAVIEALGGTVRFEKSQNVVYFGVGPVAAAYDIGKRALIDSAYKSTGRSDLFRVVGKVGTVYMTDGTLKTLVAQAGGSVQTVVRGGAATMSCQIPSTMTDALGTQHTTFPTKAGKMRLVTLAPNLAENCFALGQGSNIIATSEYTDYPEAARKIPTVGAFSNPSLERLLVLSPDLILVTNGTPLAVVDRLKKMGRTVYADNPRTLLEIVSAIRSLSVVLGVPDRGYEVSLGMYRAIERVAAAGAKLPRKPSVYIELWNSPLMSAGKDTFVSDIVHVAGGINIGDDTDTAWPTLSEEFVISHNPDVIVVASGMGAGDVTGRTSFSTVKAVQLGQVYDMVGDYIFRPSPRIIQGLEMIADYVQRAAQH